LSAKNSTVWSLAQGRLTDNAVDDAASLSPLSKQKQTI